MKSHTPINSFQKLAISHRNGVSLVEVLFAMMIAVVGLAGVLAIFPLAARQAADSYSLNQATNGAMSVASASAAKGLLPSETSPWIFNDDNRNIVADGRQDAYNPPLNIYSANGERYRPIKSISKFYDGLRQKAIVESPTLALSALRKTIGQGFCYDPLYLANVGQGPSDFLPGNMMRRTRMPFFAEQIDPTGFDGDGHFIVNSDWASIFTPRLIRVSSLQNPKFNIAASFPPVPLSAINANARVSSFGDLIPASIQADKSFGALREFDGVDYGALLSAPNNSELSWFATIVPLESKLTDYPTQFTVTVVVVKKRDRTFDVPDGSSAITVLPENERIALVTSMGSNPNAPMGVPGQIPGMPYSTSSLLNVTLHFDSRSPSTLRIGDYVMLSRNVVWELPDSAANDMRYVHRHAWYRVVAVGEQEDSDLTTPQISREVVLQGRAWDYPDLNLSFNPTLAPSPPYYYIRTTATVIENVVAVYEYPILITD